jgi:hypothetical protein
VRTIFVLIVSPNFYLSWISSSGKNNEGSVGVAVVQKNNSNQPLGTKEITAGRWGILFAVSAAFTVALYTLWGRAAAMHMHPFTLFPCDHYLFILPSPG